LTTPERHGLTANWTDGVHLLASSAGDFYATLRATQAGTELFGGVLGMSASFPTHSGVQDWRNTAAIVTGNSPRKIGGRQRN
jgi:hypothetical protein